MRTPRTRHRGSAALPAPWSRTGVAEPVGRAGAADPAAAMALLAPLERRVLWLRLARGLTSAEVAERLSMTPADVRLVQHRALEALRGHLGGGAGGGS